MAAGWTILSLPLGAPGVVGPGSWVWNQAPALDNVPRFPMPAGRWRRWHDGGAQSIVAGSNTQLTFAPTRASYKIDGVEQTSSAACGNQIGYLSPALCAALLHEAKVAMVVKDFDVSTGGVPRINNYLFGGAFTNTTRSNLTITAIT